MINKKAQFDTARKSIYWTLSGVVITIVILGFLLIITNHRNQLTQVPPELRAELISLRFANIPECFAYQDANTNRIYPGIIDLDKFNRERLNSCYLTAEEEGIYDYNFGLKLEEQGSEIITNNYFNDVDFTLYKTVVVKNGNHWLRDRLVIYVQVKI